MQIKSVKRPWIKEESHRHSHRNDRGFNYQSKAWTTTRNAFIKANPVCKCGKPANVADHRVRVKENGDPYAWSNLQALCSSCHNKKDNNASKKRRH